ncbi:sensor domain-containing protein [Frateuria terrea]|uniref:PAS domain S-box-containing protein/diguanylate cyclase (GGDEF) domain-containing protein n=1 Tax=Frateuria terrea TaxID=529704 RepID=A0A1H6T025_9GAMM|nr:GGDEF and EAL domain-containing protein [Frateuria terrea]SEI73458.1 PAS domain S-box-containing protein/diguanylate cyclase (GGDEF) domain-containing protein [Frateuria terrea]SFP29763.1 PAS domain S-box-containing protein/diguanylate cyclase (GGDEF) domain-containing protein [Frateuria terrea]
MNQPLSPDGSRSDPSEDAGHSARNWPEHVLRGVPALIAYLDPELCVRFANQPPRRWLGRPAEGLAGRQLDELLDEASAPRVIEALQAALGGRPSTVEGVLFAGRAHRYMHASFQPDADPQGRVHGAFAVFIDITERHALELKLRESEQRFFGAFQHAAIGMALVRPDGRFLRVNEAVCRMLGYSEEEFLTLSIADITHPDDYADDAAQLQQMLAGDSDAYQMEKRNLHKDGHVVHFQLSVSLVRDEHGKPLYFVSQVEDISQRKQYEEALFRERELAEVTLNSIGDAVIAADLELRITLLNPIAEGLTGWSATEARGRSMDEVFRLRDARTGASLANPLRTAMERNAIVDLEGKAVLLHRNGFETPIEDSSAPIHDHAGHAIGGVLVFRDVSETRALALKMIHLTQLDTLTGLPNRSQMQGQIEQVVATARRRQQRCALLHIDIDHFKRINEQHGPSNGDRVLRAFAARLRQALKDDDLLCRHHGDEFVVVLPQVEAPGQAASVAQRLIAYGERTAVAGLPELTLRLSVGISVFPDDAPDADSLLRNADSAMYEVKVGGRQSYRFFTPSMNERAAARRRIEAELRQAMARNQLSLFYQPKVDATDGRIVGAEVLLRWYGPDGTERYPPEQFIAVAEDVGLIVPVGAWVLREACRQGDVWHQQEMGVPIAVNVSPLQFQHASFLAELEAVLADCSLDPALLELELTERTVMAGGDATIALLQRIKRCGVRLSLDDFGTGYCSLSYLKHFPVDALKIDRAFVRDVETDANTAAITQAIIAMARSLGKTVVAEGVENEAQAEYLRAAGCEQLQGFLYGAPMDANAFGKLLTEQHLLRWASEGGT